MEPQADEESQRGVPVGRRGSFFALVVDIAVAVVEGAKAADHAEVLLHVTVVMRHFAKFLAAAVDGDLFIAKATALLVFVISSIIMGGVQEVNQAVGFEPDEFVSVVIREPRNAA